ncbi:hypothetical protein C7R54_14360 [Achromobacter aloeverae]|uniref:Translocator protein BipB-like C-terminal domain-containing protein n=2 Tax=Achromobacter aloeverae TaxID=1750518 RepID=A0A4Q1HI39_9BURK|nr:hypothetical protein C7R54_14360 [Achromobacter aloeverae]
MALSPLFFSAPGVPLFRDAPEGGLGALADQARMDYPALQDHDALSNANGAPALPRHYSSPEDSPWANVDFQVLLALIDNLKTMTSLAQMDSAKTSMKNRIEAKETLQNTVDAKRKEAREHQGTARKKGLFARIFGLVAQVITTIGLGIALAASVASGAGLLASPALLAMFAASALGVVEKSVQLAGKEDFSITGALCSAVTAGLKAMGMRDDLAEKVGNVIGSAIMVATVVGLINDPSTAGRLWGNAAQLVGVSKAAAEKIEMAMTVVATVGVMAFSFGNAASSMRAAGGASEMVARLGGGLTLQSVSVGADVGGNLANGLASGVGGILNGLAAWDTYQGEKLGAECYQLQSEIKIADGWNSMEADNLKRVSDNYSEWREFQTLFTQLQGDALARVASFGATA